jgi:hypothetical protein
MCEKKNIFKGNILIRRWYQHCRFTLSKDEYRAALIIYHIGGKSVWTVLVITLGRGHMCKHSGGMLVVLLSCILLLQQNHTQNF